jgi:peptidoglycan-associated lipoprotein
MAFTILRHDIPLIPIKKDSMIVLEHIYFDFNKATLRPESRGEINRLINFMRENPNVVVEISGHTDNVGSDKYNIGLSQRRAQAVVNELLQAGISPQRMIAKGYGFRKPRQLEERLKRKRDAGDRRSDGVLIKEIIKETNLTPEGRQLNRRVEFKIIRID